MKSLQHCYVPLSVLVSVVAASGCAGSGANTSSSTPNETTTTAAVPTANDTYDRSKDPSASNAGVGTTEMQTQPPASTTQGTPQASAPAADATMNDGQIAGVASRIDQAEIDAGKLALAHAKSARVRQFAQHMVSAHSAVETKLTSMLKAQGLATSDSPVSDKLMSETQAQKQSLMGQSGVDFDRSYMNAQLQDHQTALDIFDNKLIAQAQNAQLKTALTDTRTKVVEHIQMAKDILASLPAQ